MVRCCFSLTQNKRAAYYTAWLVAAHNDQQRTITKSYNVQPGPEMCGTGIHSCLKGLSVKRLNSSSLALRIA